jgi:signal transduction histidine kinase
MVNAIDRMDGRAEGQAPLGRDAARLANAATTDLARALAPGALLLRQDRPEGADPRALELLGLPDAAGLAAAGETLAAALAGAGLDGEPALLPLGAGGRPLVVEARRLAGDGGPTLVLLSDPAALAAAAADLAQAQHLRTLTQISPAVAHDLRAPINAMVFNLEILKETIAAGKGAEPAGRERQLRYVTVLRDELARLHGELEIFLSQTSGRGDHTESLDLRELVSELTALLVPPGRKIQVQVSSALPDQPVTVAANRWLLRQALLQVGVAALARVAQPGQLAATLASHGGRARLRLAGPAAPEAPAASFEIGLADRGAEAARPAPARLYVARALLAAQGGELRPIAAGKEAGFEVEWSISAI